MPPNLFVIGSAKCGTTSLHQYLDLHPEIQMSTPIKEPNYFVTSEEILRWRWGRVAHEEEYERLFPGDAVIRGEASTAYTELPSGSTVPRDMQAVSPHPYLIYIVRDPIERIRALYVQRSTRRHLGPLRDAIGGGADRVNHLLCGSLYMSQLEQYVKVFGDDRMLVVDQDDLLNERRVTLARIFAFLGVDRAFSSADFARVANTSHGKEAVSRRFDRIRYARALRAAARPLPVAVKRRVIWSMKDRMTAPAEKPIVDDALRARLASVLSPEVERLRQYTGQGFSSWSV